MATLLRRELPIGHWGTPSDVASAAVFLASEMSDYICGAVLTVDGGWITGKGY
jgi:2-deoxy-D-gluconate 3-dehydrogenase